jgi:glycosyltransferase involved in cell wall biosynthesis
MTIVSVIIRTQNRLCLLQRAVESVNKQTLRDWEIVIVNDGGNPSNIELSVRASGISEDKIHFIHHPKSIGRCAAGNSAIPLTSGFYLVFLDDDDTWESTFLEKTVRFLQQNPHHGGVITQVSRVGETIHQGKVTKGKVTPFIYQPEKVSLIDLAERNFIPMHSIVFPKAIGAKFGFFDSSLKLLEDWDLFLKITSEHEIGVIPERLANYHFRTKSDEPQYINSVTVSKDECLYYETFLRNKHLRKDFESGKFGLGVLMNLSFGMRELRFWHTVKRDLKRLTNLFIGLIPFRNKI